MESRVRLGLTTQASYDEWLQTWQQNASGNWVDTQPRQEKRIKDIVDGVWTFVPANAGKGRKER
jgi:hypothetical protein